MKANSKRGHKLLGAALCASICATATLPVGSAFSQTITKSSAPTSPQLAATDRCSLLHGLKVADIEIVSADSQAAGTLPAGVQGWLEPIQGVPAFCRVVGIARPTNNSVIGFEIWLPSNGWNGRLHGIGVGGFAGFIDYNALAGAVKGGQAGLATDTGHQGQIMDSSWAKGHPERVRDYGYRAIHAATVAGKKIIEAFYGRAPDHSYFVGCSGGGRQGLMEAARYPADYDGVLAGAPAASWTDLAMAMANAYQAQLAPGASLRPDQMEFLEAEVIQQCDKIDGQIDGLIADPRMCRLNTSRLKCRNGASAQCFTEPQVTALARIYAGARDSRGRQLAGGYPPGGSEVGKFGWEGYILNSSAANSGGAAHVNGLFGNFIQHPFANAATFNFDNDPTLLRRALSDDLDAPANLSRFVERGGKLILWHGWADPAIPPEATLHYFAEYQAQSGPKAKDSARLFMVPNTQHCAGGNGPASFGQASTPADGDTPSNNLVAALQHWVENGQAPASVVATRGAGYYGLPAQGPFQKRLLCAWPETSVLRTGRDPALAESYICKGSH